jgi:ABC-type branched-subunit amino acid transport system permease subunit
VPPAGIIAFGLVAGSLAGLNSIGFVLLWRTSRVVNLAQPGLGLVGGVVTGMLVVANRWSFWWALPVGLMVGAGLSVLAERAVLSKLQEVPRSVLLIATIGLAQIFSGMYSAIPFIFGGILPTYSIDLGFDVTVEPFVLLGPHLLALVALPLVAFSVHLFLTRSRIGVAALALGQDSERARALGVPAGLVRTVVWAIAGAIGSISGILSIPVLGFGLEGGALTPTVLLLALAPAVLAGLRSIWAAAAAALALGVFSQSATWIFGTAGPGDLVLVLALVGALALRRGRVGREEAAARASSWEAATTVRPLPWRLAADARVHAAGVALAVLAVLVVAIPPLLLSPSERVQYGTAAAFALGALGVSTAWVFTGELPLGHWGFAGLGAALGVVAPGPWGLKALIAGLAISILMGGLGAITRTHSSLAFSVLGLAAAASAPIAIQAAGRGVVRADTRIVGLVGGVLSVVVVILLVKLRSSTFGAGMVAARDDPGRAPWLGVDPIKTRIVGLALSGLIVGAAGVLFIASTPAGIAPGAFRPERSLALLAIAVVGGLGSPAGALVAAAALTGAERVLPSPWNGLTSGLGVVLVVLFMPAGLASGIQRIRDGAIRVIGAGDPRPPRVAAHAERVEVPT